MLNTLLRIILLVTAFFLAACASYSPSINDSLEAKTALYRLSTEQAKRIVGATMTSHFAGREVRPLEGTTIGFTTYTRMVIDTWSTTVTIVPVATIIDGNTVKALKIDIRGTGSSFLTGRIHYENFKERLAEELARTGSIIYASQYVIE